MALEQHELDTLIDGVARHMTAGDPGAAFTSNVLARLGERRSIWRAPWVLSPIAAAALIVIAVAVFRHEAGPKGPALQTAAQAGPKGGQDQSRPGPFGPGTKAAEAGPRGPALQIGNQMPSGIDALTMPSIAVEQLAPVPLAPVDSLEADPLTIAPLTVAPFDGGDDIQRRFE